MHNSLHEQAMVDIQFMDRAIELAQKGIYSTKPNPAVGCVLVKDGLIIGEGWHQRAGQPHAERIALAQALQAGYAVKGATAYVTLEPCSHHGRTPPCADALVAAEVAKVVVAMLDPNPLVAGQGVQRIQSAGIEVQVGVLESQARALNPGFIRAMESKLPFVRLKIASSLDGRTAMANGESQWITGAESRVEVHRMRARCGAVITGVGTVLADDPSLTVRLPEAELHRMNLTQENCHPLRVVLDSNLRMPLTAKMLTAPGRTLVMTSKAAVDKNPERVALFRQHNIEWVEVVVQDGRLDIESVLHHLVQHEQVTEAMVESGAMVAGAFIQAGLVNELHCFMAPSLMGELAKPMFVLPGMVSMAQKIVLKFQSVDTFGEDVRLILTPERVVA